MSTSADDLFEFADEADIKLPVDPNEGDAGWAWRVLVVDDEPQVQAVTQLVLEDLRFDGRPLKFDNAFSGAEARELLEHNDYALVLLDVVMATDDDGLQVARWLRTVKQEMITRIVLRTGQPGLAPEREVMLDYDINDYQPKAELSSQRLATAVIGAIRSYRDLHTIREQKAGLEKIVQATATLFDRRSTAQLVSGVLQQITALIGPANSALFLQNDGNGSETQILAATGRFEGDAGKSMGAVLPADRHAEVASLLMRCESGRTADWSLHVMVHGPERAALRAGVYLEPARRIDPWQERLLDLFCANAAVAFENQRLNAEQAELLKAFGRFVPQRMLEAIGVTDITRVAVGDQTQRDMTVMFVDVRSFTPLAERCGARETFRVLNTLFAEIVPIVHEYGGVVDKYLGDGLLSLFADPGDGPLLAALAMLQAVDRISRSLSDQIGDRLDIGIGIHRGPTILGLVGAEERLESTVISDAVNVASRLERLTRLYGARVVVSASALSPESTLRSEARKLGPQSVRGKSAAVDCFELFAADPAPIRAGKLASRPAFEQAIELLTDQRWDEARDAFAHIVSQQATDEVAVEFAALALRSERP